MINLSAEMHCDECKQLVASVGPEDCHITTLLEKLEAKAKLHGARVEIVTVTCADCLKRDREVIALGPMDFRPKTT